MKNIHFLYFFIFFVILFSSSLFSGCHDAFVIDDLTIVEDSLGYEKLVGTYIFKPSAEQAKRLKMDSSEVVTLRITKDSLVNFKSGRYEGRYYIDKMILMIDSSYQKKPYSSTWEYSFSNVSAFNWLILQQSVQTESNLWYQIERSANSDTLHITGYANDPDHETIRLLDFKKIK